MPVSGHQTKANRALKQRLHAGDTGRLLLGRGTSEVSVYFMQGGVVGAEATDDILHILRRLLLGGYVSADRAQNLLASAKAEPVIGTLLDEVKIDVMDAILQDRFVDNMARAMAFNGKPRFTHMAAVFLDNFQMGHDSEVLVDASADRIDAARSVDLEIDLVPGSEPPNGGLEKAFVLRLGKGISASDLVLQVPAEPLAARALIRHMLDRGVFRVAGEEAEAPELAEPDASEDIAADIATAVATEQEAASFQPEPEAESADQATEEVVVDEPTELGNRSQLSGWMDQGSELEADLEAFSDHEHTRGDGQGAFSTKEHNLDKVEVQTLPETISVDDAPTAKYGAPVLSEDSALSKVNVTADVLRTIVTAFDISHGAGRGQAAVQLLLDGSPANFQPLFEDVQAADDGSLPDESILRNLYRRPASEHRTLLQQGLLNLIDRALSSACDSLPDDAVDELLENTAGYRQRMGI